MVLFPASRPYTEDENLLDEIAAYDGGRGEIRNPAHRPSAQLAGLEPAGAVPVSSTLHLYRRFKSLVFLTENAEHNEVFAIRRGCASSGVGRLKPLLALGSRRHPSLQHTGYPWPMVAGMFNAGVVAVGTTATVRRAIGSRRAR